MSVQYIIAKYLRCSTDKQELSVQEGVLNKFIERYTQDHPEKQIVIQEYKDENISGKNTQNRPALIEMINRIKKNQINCVIITKLDRLARSLQDLLNTVNIFREYKCDFIVTDQSIDTSTPQGMLMFHILGAFAEFERSIILERMNAGWMKARLMGSKSGQPCHRPKSKLDEDGVVYKFKNKVSMNQIAKTYNVSITPIRRILRSHGLIYSGGGKTE